MEQTAPKRWCLRPTDESRVQELAAKVGLLRPIARALALRGPEVAEDVDAFLAPRLADLSDPFRLPGMERVTERIWRAIAEEETIVVFGDYDVDGVTATALLTRVLAVLGARVKPFIPDRLDEGYGLSRDALERCLAEHPATLLVTVDCGVNSGASVAFAQARGVDVIVTDHHEPETPAGQAYALVHPKLGPEKSLEVLSGAGIAFKLAHALVKHGRQAGRDLANQVDLREYLDIAALGTVADMVPLRGENRIIVKHGLAQLDRPRWEGMRALKAVAGIRETVDTYHLGFQLGPRINAAGRIGQPMQALHLLTTDDPVEAQEIAALLDHTNLERHDMERKMAEEAFAEIDAYFDPERDFGIVVAKAGWHPGVVGIVASRVSNRYNRPAIVLGIEENGHAKGSCRSIEGFDVLQGLHACRTCLAKYGGHRMAAGVEVSEGQVDQFRQRFNRIAAEKLEGMELSPQLSIDAYVDADELDWAFFEQLKCMQPFGQENPEPVWALRSVRMQGMPKVVGDKHLKFTVAAASTSFEVIAFNHSTANIPVGGFDIAFVLKEDVWRGRQSLQLQLKDLRAIGDG